MRNTQTAYKLEGAACLVCFVFVALALHFGGHSLFALTLALVLSFLGACFGLSYMRTWKTAYRIVVLSILLIIALTLYLALLLPRR